MTNKPHVYTILLQEEKIAELAKRNRELESGYLEICKINEGLRNRIRRLERSENELNGVNI